MDANYYTTYLKAYLTDVGDARKDMKVYNDKKSEKGRKCPTGVR